MSYSVVPLDTCNVNPYDRGYSTPLLWMVRLGYLLICSIPVTHRKLHPYIHCGAAQDDRPPTTVASSLRIASTRSP